MRDYLFKAKLKHTNLPHKKGDWVEGDLVTIVDGEYVKYFIYGMGEVDPETICQFIEKYDADMCRIFNGDICVRYFDGDGPGTPEKHTNKDTMVVWWNKSLSAYSCRFMIDGKLMPKEHITCPTTALAGSVYVVGNIHDND